MYSLVHHIRTYNCEIWYMDVFRSYYNATLRANKTAIRIFFFKAISSCNYKSELRHTMYIYDN